MFKIIRCGLNGEIKDAIEITDKIEATKLFIEATAWYNDDIVKLEYEPLSVKLERDEQNRVIKVMDSIEFDLVCKQEGGMLFRRAIDDRDYEFIHKIDYKDAK